LSKKEEEG
jgi:hypothetical protein